MNKKLTKILVLGLFMVVVPQLLFAMTKSVEESNLTEKMAMLVFQLSFILIAAWCGGFVFEKLKLPKVLGEIFSGTIIGPYCFGAIPFWGFPQGFFPLQPDFPVTVELYSFTAVAAIILLFLVGLETDINTFFRFSLAGSVIGIGGVFFSFIFGDFLGIIIARNLLGLNCGFMHPVPLFLGIISTATSVGITARILSEKRKMNSPEGVTILAGAVIDDILGIIILAIVIGISKTEHVQWNSVAKIALKAVGIWFIFSLLGITCSRYLSRFLKKIKDKTTISIISLALAFLLAGIFEKSGLAMIIGAYIMGLSLSKTDLSYIIQDQLTVLQKFLVPIFFCVMGMLLNISEVANPTILTYGLIYSAVAIAGKLIGCSIPAMFLNFNFQGALRIGVGMIPRGEVALIMAGIGLSLGILENEIFSIAIIMTFITTLITPAILERLLQSKKKVLRKEQTASQDDKEVIYTMPNPETSEFLLQKIVAVFESEGFYVLAIKVPDLIYKIRKNRMSITLRYSDDALIFDCLAQDESFIHTLFYEVLAELEQNMKKLQVLTNKADIGKKIFGVSQTVINSKAKVYSGETPFSVLTPLAMQIDLKGNTKEEIIRELTELLVSSGQLNQDEFEPVLSDLLEREANMSTGMQFGIALPHAKSVSIDKIISAVGLKKQGVNFESLDNQDSKIFVVTVAPKDSPQSYLMYMSEITKFLMVDANRTAILASKNNSELHQVFNRHG
ncbi:MAG: cation:proton antiporter [Candidatus Omnitrophica bacterium]|nr:cation:proton antiporter [Candidatus Omnitrophota bacterium]